MKLKNCVVGITTNTIVTVAVPDDKNEEFHCTFGIGSEIKFKDKDGWTLKGTVENKIRRRARDQMTYEITLVQHRTAKDKVRVSGGNAALLPKKKKGKKK